VFDRLNICIANKLTGDCGWNYIVSRIQWPSRIVSTTKVTELSWWKRPVNFRMHMSNRSLTQVYLPLATLLIRLCFIINWLLAFVSDSLLTKCFVDDDTRDSSIHQRSCLYPTKCFNARWPVIVLSSVTFVLLNSSENLLLPWHQEQEQEA